jgi:hypothetical protein
MAMLDFGVKRIIEKLLIANVIWILACFIMDLIESNPFDKLLYNLLNGHINIATHWKIYFLPTLVLLVYGFFYEHIVRLEIKDDTLLVTGLKFFSIHTIQIKKENITYRTTLRRRYKLSYVKDLRIYEKSIERYIIETSDLNEEEFDQVLSFLRVHFPVSAKLQEI